LKFTIVGYENIFPTQDWKSNFAITFWKGNESWNDHKKFNQPAIDLIARSQGGFASDLTENLTVLGNTGCLISLEPKQIEFFDSSDLKATFEGFDKSYNISATNQIVLSNDFFLFLFNSPIQSPSAKRLNQLRADRAAGSLSFNQQDNTTGITRNLTEAEKDSLENSQKKMASSPISQFYSPFFTKFISSQKY
jgi:hypothetical protein